MSIEVFNIKKAAKTEKLARLSKSMTATEARNELNAVVANLAVAELERAIEKVKKSISEGKNFTTFAFSYGGSLEVITATIAMLRNLGYEVKVSNYYNDIINIIVK